jgi:hypothetical protein
MGNVLPLRGEEAPSALRSLDGDGSLREFHCSGDMRDPHRGHLPSSSTISRMVARH